MVTADNLRVFLKNFTCARLLNEDDIKAWVSRFDRNVDGKMSFSDLVGALQTMTNFVRQNTPIPEHLLDEGMQTKLAKTATVATNS